MNQYLGRTLGGSGAMRCTSGHENPDGNAFCGVCGEQILEGHASTIAVLPPYPIRSPRDAESAACAAMRFWGYADAALTPIGPDEGVDVQSSAAIAQVKAQLVPTGIAEVQQLLGAATAAGKSALFFSLAGYTEPALRWASSANIALFEFDLSGRPSPLNGAASATSVPASPARQTPQAELAWAQRLASRPKDQVVISGTAAIIACDGVAVALDVRTGRILWEEVLYSDSDDVGQVTASEGVVATAEATGYAFSKTTRLRRLALDTGATLWETSLSGLVAAGAASADCIVGTGWANDGSKFVWALDSATGRLRFRLDRAVERIGFAALLPGLVVFVEESDNTGESVVALDAHTGSLTWTVKLTPASHHAASHLGYIRLSILEDSVLLADGVGNQGVGRVWRIGADGALLWQSSRVLRYPANPVAAFGQLSVVGSGMVASIDPATGAERWRIGVEDWIQQQYHWAIPVEGAIVYAVSERVRDTRHSFIACADGESGAELWRWGTEIPFAFGPEAERAPGDLIVFPTTSAIGALDVRSALGIGDQAVRNIIEEQAPVTALPDLSNREAFDAEVDRQVQAEIQRAQDELARLTEELDVLDSDDY